jgi:hypothetical protein
VTDNNQPDWLEEARLRQRLREAQDSAGTEPSPQHDAQILDAVRATAGKIRQRADTRSAKPGWLPVSLAAALMLGIVIGRGSWVMWNPRAQAVHLTIPNEVPVRGSSNTGRGSSVPVEQADPAAWYRYIQELVFSGQTELAEEHLRRFRELYPDFVYQP